MIHGRRSLRLRGYGYTEAGAYYVTVVTWKRASLFGEIVNSKMHLSEAGQNVAECWNAVPRHTPWVILDAFVVMPNHVHGIVFIAKDPVGAQHAAPLQNGYRGPRPHSLGAIVRSFKSAATRQMNLLRGTPGAPVWQRNYYEHVIRSEDELNRIRQYIEENPARWEEDEQNPGYVTRAL